MNSWKKTFDKRLSYIGKGNFTQLLSFGYTFLIFTKLELGKFCKLSIKLAIILWLHFQVFAPKQKCTRCKVSNKIKMPHCWWNNLINFQFHCISSFINFRFDTLLCNICGKDKQGESKSNISQRSSNFLWHIVATFPFENLVWNLQKAEERSGIFHKKTSTLSINHNNILFFLFPTEHIWVSIVNDVNQILQIDQLHMDVLRRILFT